MSSSARFGQAHPCSFDLPFPSTPGSDHNFGKSWQGPQVKNRRNYYRILHVEPDAPTAIIRASYRAIMARLQVHPDLGGDHAAAVLVNEAFATLSDPLRRAAYDRTLLQSVEQRRGARPAKAKGTAPNGSSATGPRAEAPRVKLGCGFCGEPYSVGEADRPDSQCHACGSPLYPVRRQPLRAQTGSAAAAADAGRATIPGMSRRALERIPRTMPVTFRLPDSRHVVWYGATEDVSPNGMRFLAQAVIPTGERVLIDCDFCRAVAVVKSVQPAPDAGRGFIRYGIEFLTIRVNRPRGSFVSSVA